MSSSFSRSAGLATRRAERLERHARRLDGSSSALAAARLVAFGAIVSAVMLAWRVPSWRFASWIAAAACLVGFVVLVRRHASVHRRFALAREVAAAARRDVLRAEGRRHELPRTGEGFARAGREADLAADLALLGPGSLFQLVSRCSTPWGERRLTSLLLAASPASDLAARQDVARELLRRGAFRRRLEAEGAIAGDELHGAAAFAARLAEPAELPGAIAPLGIALAIVTVGQAIASLAWGAPTLIWPTLGLNVVLSALLGRRLHAAYAPLLDREAPVLACSRMLALVETRGGSAPLARRWRDDVTRPLPASRALRELSSILGALSLRRNALWALAQAFLLWDFWQVPRLLRWKRRHGASVSAWLETLGEIEACSSLAAHGALFGGAFAEVRDDGPAFAAESLAHALLHPMRAVANDLVLDGNGRVLLLTGSNMSGKSTLLRSAGVAAVVALAGGPACAARLRLRPCRVLTSIRVSDALDEGVSLFYAEVRRLRAVVEAAEEADHGEGLAVLFLVDEILRGTNARERHLAARAIVARLAATGSPGIVTSHDVELADLEGSVPGVVNGHFREEIREGRMTFDHVLRPGPVTTSNALEILRLEGIEVPRRGATD